MKKEMLSGVLMVLALTGCVSTNYGTAYESSYPSTQQRPNQREVMYGTIVDIRPVAVTARGTGGGAVIGAVIGGVLGNQVGGGRGRDLATVGGAIAGGVIGNNIEKQQAENAHRTVYEIFVRLEDGRVLGVIQEHRYGLSVGRAVEVIKSGEYAQVIAR